jgi:hypothetical protein
MRTNIQARRAVVAAIIGFLPLSAQAAPWVMGVAPRHVRVQTTMIPLAAFVARAAGHPVTVWRAGPSWFGYAAHIARGQFALAFDGAIFTGWRDQYRNYHPLVRLSGAMRFVVVTNAVTRSIHTMRDLDGRPVCAAPLPNMATMALLAKTSRIAPPYIEPQGGIARNYQGLVSGYCQAAVLPAHFYNRLPPASRAGLHVLYRTHAFPNLALSAGPQVPHAVRVQIRRALLSPAGEALAARLFPGRRFVAAAPTDYAPYAGDLQRMAFFQGMLKSPTPN